MSSRLALILVATTLATAACANPVGSSAEQQKAPRVSHDQSATTGGNMMGGGS